MPHTPHSIWKLTIAPSGQTDPSIGPAQSFAFCRDRDPQVIGVGWALPGVGDDRKEAIRRARSKWGRNGYTALRALVDRMRQGDHVWVYGDGRYYVCLIRSDWQHGEGSEWDRYDIHHYREADWREVPRVLVAGAIKRHLHQRGTVQEMHVSHTVKEYSAFTYVRSRTLADLRAVVDLAELARALERLEPQRLFEALDEDETEDLVGLYLQSQGWQLLKSSAYRTQPDVECQFQRAEAGGAATAYMQVKSGTTVSLKPSSYREFVEDGSRVFLFSTAKAPYQGQSVNGVECLAQQTIREFALQNLALLPYPMILKLAIVAGIVSLP